jgi:hypothetical protein
MICALYFSSSAWLSWWHATRPGAGGVLLSERFCALATPADLLLLPHGPVRQSAHLCGDMALSFCRVALPLSGVAFALCHMALSFCSFPSVFHLLPLFVGTPGVSSHLWMLPRWRSTCSTEPIIPYPLYRALLLRPYRCRTARVHTRAGVDHFTLQCSLRRDLST